MLSASIRTSLFLPRPSRWHIVDSGFLSGADNMRTDRAALDRALSGAPFEPTLRFFGWSEPTVTYGYLLDPASVKSWAAKYPSAPLVQRPTGGGAVYHAETDLSLSLVWPRASNLFSDRPRDCYAEIHATLKPALESLTGGAFSLKRPSDAKNACAAASDNRFSACFQEPVCNDVMAGDKKIVGGALRVAKTALLYQGSIQLPVRAPREWLVSALAAAFGR